MSCLHVNFDAVVDVHRLFGDEVDKADALAVAPDSVVVEVRVSCRACGKKVRFEGPVGTDVGPGGRPKVSPDGTELRAPGHLGENRTPPVRISMSVPTLPDEPQVGGAS